MSSWTRRVASPVAAIIIIKLINRMFVWEQIVIGIFTGIASWRCGGASTTAATAKEINDDSDDDARGPSRPTPRPKTTTRRRRTLADVIEALPHAEQFKCPITRKLMVDPVICADGHTYDARDREVAAHRAHEPQDPCVSSTR